MNHLNHTNLQDAGTTEYIDCKKNIHTVKHSVIFAEKEKWELEDKIVEDLYRIFTHSING